MCFILLIFDLNLLIQYFQIWSARIIFEFIHSGEEISFGLTVSDRIEN